MLRKPSSNCQGTLNIKGSLIEFEDMKTQLKSKQDKGK